VTFDFSQMLLLLAIWQYHSTSCSHRL
jgi:hypothetical protein